MTDIVIPEEAVGIVADHCFGPFETPSREETARVIAGVALEDAYDTLITPELRALLPPTDLAPAERNRWVYARLIARLKGLGATGCVEETNDDQP
jgi:hypothetical protein